MTYFWHCHSKIAAVIFTLVNVWLAVKENIWTWPTGIVGVVLYTFVFYWRKLYLNAWLQIVYFVLSIHGWYEWLHGGVNKSERRISWRLRPDVGGFDAGRRRADAAAVLPRAPIRARGLAPDLGRA